LPAFKLEKHPSKPEFTVGDTVMLLYGPPKIGKTELASYFPGVYFLTTEPGVKFRRVRSSPLHTWERFLAACDAIRDDDSIRTVVIDRVDTLFKYAMAYVCERDDVDHPSDESHGKGWHRTGIEWAEGIDKVVNLQKGVIFIAHEAERRYATSAVELTKKGPNIPKTGYDVLNGVCDWLFYYGMLWMKVKTKSGKMKGKIVRALQCRPTEDIDAGDRTGYFSPTVRMPYGRAAYEKLVQAFDEALEQIDKKIAADQGAD